MAASPSVPHPGLSWDPVGAKRCFFSPSQTPQNLFLLRSCSRAVLPCSCLVYNPPQPLPGLHKLPLQRRAPCSPHSCPPAHFFSPSRAGKRTKAWPPSARTAARPSPSSRWLTVSTGARGQQDPRLSESSGSDHEATGLIRPPQFPFLPFPAQFGERGACGGTEGADRSRWGP